MMPFLESTQKQFVSLGVTAMYLFGSRAQGVEGPLSDYDFGVLTRDGGHRRGDALYDTLYDILAPLCPRMLANDVIDIVFLKDAPLELCFHVIRYGKVIFDVDPKNRANFEERVQTLYCDYRPLLNMFDSAILQAI